MPHAAQASDRPSRLAGFVRHLLLAVQYFTRVPLPGRLAAWVGYSPAMMKAATAHFPGVGWLVAGVSAAVLALGWWLLRGQLALVALVAVVLSMIASAWLTGAIHEDGLADVCDGLGGSADRETAMRIMKDSRLGSYAAMALVLALITLFVSNRLVRMPVGRAWEALREDEIACRSLGLNPTRIKLSAFTLGAMFAGFGGAFFAARQGLVNPESFTFIESALILAIVVLGGMGSQLGVILAAIILTVLPEVAREFADYRMLIFGLVMVLMMIWRPEGLLPVKRPHVELTR